MVDDATRHSVAILLFDDVEVLDFAGPFEVFSRARLVPGVDSRRSDDSAPFEVFTVAKESEPVRAVGGLVVHPDYDFAAHPPIDVLVVPGGFGTRPLLEDEATLAFVRATAQQAKTTTSVCSGSLLLGKVGLLDGRRATSHWGALEALAELVPTARVMPESRYVDDGIITSAGVAAGIDMSLYVVEQYCGKAVADETAHYIDYPRTGTPPPENRAVGTDYGSS